MVIFSDEKALTLHSRAYASQGAGANVHLSSRELSHARISGATASIPLLLANSALNQTHALMRYLY